MKINKKEILEKTKNYTCWDDYRSFGLWYHDNISKTWNETVKMCTFLFKIAKKRHICIPKV